ncbi:MAG: hypothetical protein SOI64_07720 [Bifidobacterium mongoliense]
MSTNTSNAFHNGSSSIHTSRESFAPARTGSSRPSRPAQIDPTVAAHIAGGADPQAIDEMSHASAAAMLDRVHHSQDPAVVERVLTLVEREGVDIIAELWSHAQPDTLPAMLWRLYLLRTWMRRHQQSLSRLWRAGEPVATVDSVVAGIDQAPEAQDIAHTADSILSGAFTGDFAVALERAAAFTDVIAGGLHAQAKRLVHGDHAPRDSAHEHTALGTTQDEPTADDRTTAARLMHTAGNLLVTARDFRSGANQWRRGRLE